MLNLTYPKSLHHLISQVSVVGTLSAITLLSGCIPGLSRGLTNISFNTAVYAQSTTQIQQYAKAVLQIEPIRRESLEKAKQIMGGNVPANVCRQDDLPNGVEGVCKNFLTRSAQIIKDSGLSIGEFNQITVRLQKDPGLKNRMRQELIEQQK